ncbi:hypothetical protein D9756_010682 [Leucocoprinus leucothites]|uniref:Uncharacterized protein n=1 Tax=Leucocoprinus leucothites TaxID=201217 RepID=A0A8H5FS44_9AGAR|nr:hypothetical protein D9756_010682 [Leucoagaricus leucothites]
MVRQQICRVQYHLQLALQSVLLDMTQIYQIHLFCLFKAFRPLARGFITHTCRASVRAPTLASPRHAFVLTRNSSTTSGDKASAGSESASNSEAQPEAPEEVSWIEVLESVAKAPWLTSTPSDHGDRLRRAYSLLFHVILYLGRPLAKDAQEAEAAAQQFLLAFNSAPVAPESEIGRARYAIGLITKTVTSDITTIPESAPIRGQHSRIFALADALVPLSEVHLEGVVQDTAPSSGEIVEEGKWQDFWTKAQPVVLALGEELDREGYGISEELIKEAKAEQERKEREATSSASGGEETK